MSQNISNVEKLAGLGTNDKKSVDYLHIILQKHQWIGYIDV